MAPEVAPYPDPSTNGAGALGDEPPEDDRRRRWLPWLLVALVLLLVAGAAAAAYFISRPKQRIVPAVTGLQLNVARTVLLNADFQVAVINVNSSKPVGVVIGEDPAPGRTADKGSTVTLSVSQGLGDTTIPSVLGLGEAAAKKELRRNHLRVRVVTRSSQQYGVGDATGTDPRSGQTVAAGTRVTLFISSGKPEKPVPNVVGLDQATASAELTGAGFNVAPTSVTSTTATAGNVISQSPGGGTDATPGSTVTITVAKAPPSVSVPSVVGDSPSSAQSALNGAGLKVTRQTQNVTDQSQNGIVISQSPRSGANAKQGSTVTIVIGKFVPSNTTTSTTSTPTTSTTTTSTTTTSTTSKSNG